MIVNPGFPLQCQYCSVKQVHWIITKSIRKISESQDRPYILASVDRIYILVTIITAPRARGGASANLSRIRVFRKSASRSPITHSRQQATYSSYGYYKNIKTNERTGTMATRIKQKQTLGPHCCYMRHCPIMLFM